MCLKKKKGINIVASINPKQEIIIKKNEIIVSYLIAIVLRINLVNQAKTLQLNLQIRLFTLNELIMPKNTERNLTTLLAYIWRNIQ